MPEFKVLNMSGEVSDKIQLADSVFGVEPNMAVLHAAVRAYLMNQRQGTQSTLTRSEVSGGGKKPWRQKGTGRARQGSTRSPQWTHGGIALGPKPRTYHINLNKKTKKLAMVSALSAKAGAGEMVIVDRIVPVVKEETGTGYNTKAMVAFLKAVGVNGKALVVLPNVNDAENPERAAKLQKMVVKSLANVEAVKTTPCGAINVYDILNCDTLVIAREAALKIEEVYTR